MPKIVIAEVGDGQYQSTLPPIRALSPNRCRENCRVLDESWDTTASSPIVFKANSGIYGTNYLQRERRMNESDIRKLHKAKQMRSVNQYP